MDKVQVEYVIKNWIDFAKKHKRINFVKDFWLLGDYVDGGLSDEYYIKHADEAVEILKSINREKGNNKEVCEYIESIVNKYVGKYKDGDGQEELFKDDRNE